MKRRQFLAWLGATGLLATTPGRLLAAANGHDLAIKGQDLLTAGQTDKALQVLLEASRVDPRNARVQALLGRTWFQRGDTRRALAAFRLAVRLNPEDTMSRIMVETIEQFPLPPTAPLPEELAGKGNAPLHRPVGQPSNLEREAEAERESLRQQGTIKSQSGPFRLLLDPGHGGADGGGQGGGIREADVALDIALRAARVLAGAKDEIDVSLTRVVDAGLPGWARAGLAGWYGADALVSIHAAQVPDARFSGVAVCALGQTASGPVASSIASVENAAYGRDSGESDLGASALFVRATSRAAATGHWRRGVALAGAMQHAWPKGAPLSVLPLQTAPLRVLAETAAPAMLVEMGFVSNPADAAVLGASEKRQVLAQHLAQAMTAMIRQSRAG